MTPLELYQYNLCKKQCGMSTSSNENFVYNYGYSGGSSSSYKPYVPYCSHGGNSSSVTGVFTGSGVTTTGTRPG